MGQHIFIITGSIFGLLAILLGAFGAHALKKILSEEQLKSFETGVKYQMYHAIVLLTLGLNSEYSTSAMYWCFSIGILFFSFSIYGLVLSSAKGKKIRLLGAITPIGGLLLAAGWLLIVLKAF
ncbi:DUF423 domain-containing protein [Winogradskyella aquimaris]|uniref:DUF423 domain-containing protein n=1 Tax=Winogradskyella aquimaris TaxID=864074 RepID=A0ABU5EML0_9FLAO|nr:DUF423 domain-containing protein [Winogradskyella aquimaris]MDY2586995.1 DUF423 domain-containing protein [Winogradskyella aquimaris]